MPAVWWLVFFGNGDRYPSQRLSLASGELWLFRVSGLSRSSPDNIWAELKGEEGGGQNVKKSKTSRGCLVGNRLWRPSESCFCGGQLREILGLS